MEAWMSGLNQQFTKLSTGNSVREFESHRLRKKKSLKRVFLFARARKQTALLSCEFERRKIKFLAKNFLSRWLDQNLLDWRGFESKPNLTVSALCYNIEMETIEFFQYIKTPTTVIHVVSVVVGMGAALVSDVFFSFFSSDKKLNKTEINVLSILAKIVFYSLIVIVVSGICIFFSDIEKYTYSAKFISKMTILGVLLLNGYILNNYVWPHLLQKNFFTAKKQISVRRVAFVCGAVSLVSWLSVCTLGVLDKVPYTYEFIMVLFTCILLFGMSTALVVEKKTLESN